VSMDPTSHPASSAHHSPGSVTTVWTARHGVRDWVVTTDRSSQVTTSARILAGPGFCTFGGQYDATDPGSFAVVRASPWMCDARGVTGIRLDARGDSSPYDVILFAAATPVHWSASFVATPAQREPVIIPLSMFEAQLRGRTPADPPALRPERLVAWGIRARTQGTGRFCIELSSFSLLR
jgi:hypothetical protein